MKKSKISGLSSHSRYLRESALKSLGSYTRVFTVSLPERLRLYARICLRTINLLNSYYLKIIFSEPSLDIRTSGFVYNYYLRKKSSLIPFCALDIYMKLYKLTLHVHTHQKQIEYPCLLSMPLGKEDYSYLFLTHLVFFSI